MTIFYSHYGLPNTPPVIINGLPTGLFEQPSVDITFSVIDDRGSAVSSTLDVVITHDPGGSPTIYNVILNGVFQSGFSGTITANAFNGFDVVVDTHAAFADGLWQADVYVEDDLGLSDTDSWQWRVALRVLPVSDPWNIYDFCEPDDSTMLYIAEYTEVTTARTFVAPQYSFNGSNDLCLYSNDAQDSGLTIEVSVPPTFSTQFTILPTALPNDFSSLATERVFVAVYNQYGKMAGLLLSENGGLAMAQDGLGTGFQHLIDSADLFTEGSAYYTFRVTVNGYTGVMNIYVTPTAQLPIIGHQLRITTPAPDSLQGHQDGMDIEVYGSASEPTTVCFDCIRLSSLEVIPNARPVADAGPNRTSTLYKYIAFDGRASYDPEGAPLRYWWTVTVAPEDSAMWLTGAGLTQTDPTDYTNVVYGPSGSAAGTFDDVVQGDQFFVEDASSIVKYVAEDGSYVVLIDHVIPDDTAVLSWSNLKQSAWEGSWIPASMLVVEDYTNTEPLTPDIDDVYLIGPSPGGNPNWVAGDAGKIATWNGVSWDIVDPTVGQIVYSIADFLSYRLIDTGPYNWIEDDPTPWELGHWTGRVAEIGTLLPDVSGLFTAELIVNDGTSMILPPNAASIDGSLTSLPSEVICNVSPTGAPLGIVPDLSFIWNYLSNFWTLANGKEMFETVWSGAAQILGGDLLELWQHDYAKGLFDIQRLFQRRWRGYDFFFQEPNYDDSLYEATIDTTVDATGYSASPGLNDYSYELGTTPPAGVVSGHMLVLNGECYEIARIAGTRLITRDILPRTTLARLYINGASGPFQLNETVTGLTSGATGIVIETGWNYLVLDTPSPTLFITTEVVTGSDTGETATVIGYTPATTQRPRYWQIRPQVVSKQTDFTLEAVSMADTAVFDIEDATENDHIRVGCFVYGARGKTLCFDDTTLATYQADPDRYTIRFFGLVHRNYLPVGESVRMLSSLQEVVDVDNVEGAPDILIGNNDFIVESITAVDGRAVQVVNLLECFFDRKDYGFDGDTTSVSGKYFDVPSGGLLTSLGEAGTDLSNHVLWIDNGSRYRLLEVISDTRIELVDEALTTGLANLHWRIFDAGDPPDRAWAETTYVDNMDTVEANYGVRVGFTQDDWLSQTEDLDYLAAVQGLWYAFWNGPTLNNIQTACQVLMGLPFAEKGGIITDIRTPFSADYNRVLVQDEGDEIVIRSYMFPVQLDVATNPDTGVAYQVGDTIEQFAPVCTGVLVEDYISNPTWMENVVGSGDMHEAQKFHTFGVTIDSAAFNYKNIIYMIGYLIRLREETTPKVRPHYTFPIAIVLLQLEDVIDIEDAIVYGPAWPPEITLAPGTYYKYPDNASWRDKLEDHPTGWGSAPAFPDPDMWETPPVYDITTRWPNDRAANVPPRTVDYGGLHLEDVSGSVPDPWSGSWPQTPAPAGGGTHTSTEREGAFLYGDTDESGHFIHVYGPPSTNLIVDSNMSAGDMSAWSIVNYGYATSTLTAVKTTLGGNAVARLTATTPDEGIEQTVSVTSGRQVFGYSLIRMISGQAHVQLYDGSGTPALLAEWRLNGPVGSWVGIPLHRWKITTATASIRILTGPAGGDFYVDEVGLYSDSPPFTQWGYGRMYLGRTGGYTVGGLPDEELEFTVYMTYP